MRPIVNHQPMDTTMKTPKLIDVCTCSCNDQAVGIAQRLRSMLTADKNSETDVQVVGIGYSHGDRFTVKCKVRSRADASMIKAFQHGINVMGKWQYPQPFTGLEHPVNHPKHPDAS